MNSRKLLVVGAGPCGASIARLCADAGFKVDLYDRRDHIAGNCYDEYDEHGVLVHRYGPHYFRTNSRELLDWLSCFTDWLPGRYYVRASVKGKLVPMPVSLATISELKGKVFSKVEFEEYLKLQRICISEPSNAEEQCLARVGRELYESLFKGYTIKQWQTHPRDLDASITARIPLRFNWDERYPQEEFQVMPAKGYTSLFQKMLEHENIKLHLNQEIGAQQLWQMRNDYRTTIFTGPIDQAFDNTFGRLEYRSLHFERKNFNQPYRQPCVQINYPDQYEYTRSVEIKHVTGQICSSTTIVYEYPIAKGEEYYPLLTESNQTLLEKYQKLAKAEETKENPVYFLGRMAEFKYYNMDQAFLAGIAKASEIISDAGILSE